MRYRRSDGRSLELSQHGPEAWAAETKSRMLALGCSEEYAEREAALIRSAVPDHGVVDDAG